jgi:hypothetical protein
VGSIHGEISSKKGENNQFVEENSVEMSFRWFLNLGICPQAKEASLENDQTHAAPNNVQVV